MAQLIYSALPQPRRPIVTIKPSLSVEKCVKKMVLDNIGALVVMEGSTLSGIVSERDIVYNCVYRGLNPKEARVGDIAWRDVKVLQLNDPIERAMETMTQTKRRHLLIAEGSELVAVLSIGDLLFYTLEEKLRVIEHLEHYIQS